MQIVVLGPLEIRAEDGGSIEVPGVRLRALLIALALEPGRVVPKTALVDWIWGEQPPADASNALQALVSRLRRVLPEGVLEGQAGGYRLVAEPDTVDAVRFEQLLDRARGVGDAHRAGLLREALDLWQGSPMQGIEARDSGAVDAVIARFEGLHSAALEDVYEAEINLGLGARLVPELADLVARNPVRERLVAALMRALGAAGRGSEALIVYQNAREALADTLGADPSPELSALHVALLRGEGGAQQSAERRTNLRAELTEYVGKFADIAAVRDLLANHRLTTLTGPGGCGKTRLAGETAQTLLDDLPDGAWLVELAAVGPSGDVAQSALAAIGLRDALLGNALHTEPVDRLIAAVRDRETLLILDNCEHVIESVAAFAHRVLGECPRLRILATSREPLGITGEALWQVQPLALPAADAGPEAIESSPAVRLLRDRAGAVRNDLTADPRTLAAIARVCRALDGIPLAIELAAARLRTLTPAQLAERLDDRFRLLTGGSRTAIPQHRTLRAVVDWSWELLTEAERMVLRRLAVFAGGASLEAAEQVCADSGAGRQVLERWEVLDLLTTLTEKSLLLTPERGIPGDTAGAGPDLPNAAGERQPRFRMLETIRQYAHERLTESGEAETARRVHLAYFTRLADTAEPHLRRAGQLEWLAVLEAEHDNISAALRTALAVGDTTGALRLAAAAGWYWWLGGHKAEGQELLTAVADEPADVDDATRALVYGLVTHFMSSGRNDAAQVGEWIRKAHRFSRGVRTGHPTLAFIDALDAMLQGPAALPSAFEPLLTDNDPWVRALSRLQMGKMRIVVGQDGPDVDAYLEGALAEFRALGERWGISFALTELANRRATRGEFVSACELYEEGIAVVSEIGSAEDIVALLSRQAQLYWLAGDPDASAAAVAEAQHRANRVAWPFALAELALSRAELSRWRGDTEQALEQVDIATTVSGGETGMPQFAAAVHTLRGYLGTDLEQAREHHAAAFRAASEAGHSLLVAQVLVGIADWALRAGRDPEAARLLAVSAVVHGVPDRSQPDAVRVERAVRDRLNEADFTEAMRAGSKADWRELAATALAVWPPDGVPARDTGGARVMESRESSTGGLTSTMVEEGRWSAGGRWGRRTQ